jgi:hypothetical protein
MAGQIKRSAEEARLLQRIKAGTATPEEIDRYEHRPIVYHLYGGTVQVTAAPEMNVEQWKAMLARKRGHDRPLIAPDESTGRTS